MCIVIPGSLLVELPVGVDKENVLGCSSMCDRLPKKAVCGGHTAAEISYEANKGTCIPVYNTHVITSNYRTRVPGTWYPVDA